MLSPFSKRLLDCCYITRLLVTLGVLFTCEYVLIFYDCCIRCCIYAGSIISTLENVASTMSLYQLTYTDQDAVDTHTFRVVSCAHFQGTVLYSISQSGSLTAAALINFEDKPSVYDIVLSVTDKSGIPINITVTVTVIDINEPPRLSDALLAASRNFFAVENLYHESHAEPRYVIDVIMNCM
jgi:hypothetical protein